VRAPKHSSPTLNTISTFHTRAQAKALVAWRTLPRAPRPAPLSPQDREVLAAQANRRLYDVAGKACLGVIRTMMQQKVGEGGAQEMSCATARLSYRWTLGAVWATSARPNLEPQPSLPPSTRGRSTTRWT
jgi:hypothetical protein